MKHRDEQSRVAPGHTVRRAIHPSQHRLAMLLIWLTCASLLFARPAHATATIPGSTLEAWVQDTLFNLILAAESRDAPASKVVVTVASPRPAENGTNRERWELLVNGKPTIYEVSAKPGADGNAGIGFQKLPPQQAEAAFVGRRTSSLPSSWVTPGQAFKINLGGLDDHWLTRQAQGASRNDAATVQGAQTFQMFRLSMDIVHKIVVVPVPPQETITLEALQRSMAGREGYSQSRIVSHPSLGRVLRWQQTVSINGGINNVAASALFLSRGQLCSINSQIPIYPGQSTQLDELRQRIEGELDALLKRISL